MSLKRVLACLLLLLLVAPTTAAFADTAVGIGSGTGMGGATLPDDIGIWEDADSFHVMYKGVQKTLTLTEKVCDYLVSVETCTDGDGKDVTIICFNLAFTTMVGGSNGVRLGGNETDGDGDVYYNVYLCSSNSYSDSKYRARSYYVTVRDGVIGDFVLARRGAHGSPSHVAMGGSGTLLDDTFYGRRTGRIYKSAFYKGDYTIYCSSPILDNGTYPYETLYPATPLPGTPPAGGEGGYPYKTTFRMLTDGATVYNTYYYTSSYMSGADEVSASGKIRLDATKLADGTVTRILPSAPQLLCQISSYGKAYDIAYTNDDNLCSLLGIEKPNELRWNVRMQAWVSPAWDDMINGTPDIGDLPETGVINPDGSSPFESAESIPKVNGLSVSTFGQDVQLKYSEYSKLYGDSLMHVSASPSAADAWGLGSTLRWSLDGDAGDFEIKLQVVAKISVQLPDGTTRSHQLILQDYDGKHPGNNTAFRVGAADGGVTLALYDLVMTLEEQHKEYITSPPAKILGVVYYLTPFYYRDGTYYRGTLASTVHSVNKAFVSVPVAPLPTPFDPTGPITDGSLWEAIGSLGDYIRTGIANAVASVGSFFSGVLGSAKGILLDLGSVPALLAEFFSFLPAEVITAIGIGLSLWLLPALLGLARSGLKALGSICSSFFGFISSFFS